MPNLPLTACLTPLCPSLVRSGYCGVCKIKRELTRPAQPKESPRSPFYGRYSWKKLRAAHLRVHPYCRVCGAKATDVDHIIPREKGGAEDPRNLQSLCHAHHSQKSIKERKPWNKRRERRNPFS